MEFTKFVEEMENKIKLYLSEEYENAKVLVEEHQKINSSYVGLSVHKENQNITPTINLNQIYEKFQNEPQMTMETILKQTAEVIEEASTQFDISNIMDYEHAKDQLFIRVSSADRNENLLKKIPHQFQDDLVITYHVAVDMNQEGMGSTTVTNDMLKNYGITLEQLHADAMENSPKMMPVHVAIMGSVVQQLFGGGPEEMLHDGTPENIAEIVAESVRVNDPMVIVTNQQMMNGASAIFYPGVMEQISEGLQGDFFILPSSTHEVLIVADDGNFDYPSLKDMVQQVNASEVSPEERLADDVYHYDSKDHVFERADRFATRMHEKELQMAKEQKMTRPKRKSHDMELS